MKYKKSRPRRNEERSEEKLRGTIRELEKEVERLKRHIGSLQKQNKRPTAKPDKTVVVDIEPDDKGNSCPNCGAPAYQLVSIPTYKGEVLWMVCQECKHREKKVSEPR